jgi:hypothetical protein
MSRREEHRWAVDGIEESVARVEEDGTRMLTVPRALLPASAREGQLLRVTRVAETDGSVTLTISVDVEGTAEALARSKAQTAHIAAASKKRDPGGDVAL